MKYYIIQHKASEYNDEVYSIQDEGGTPVKVFKTRQDAEAQLDKLELKELIGLEIIQWGYDTNEIFKDVNIFLNILNSMLGTDINEDELEYDWTFPEMTLAQYRKIKPFIRLNFFEVVECEGVE